ncbi:Heterokaryon incompatibility [Cordyceps militaris]|uniref:Heterokaryon incompatibility n=1 Tax=Cordyceps militaris TaxID=73501 RepID=A0A2H4SF58_CORMI|nr:Heterokaryon incompatibility [Cordyceps militaris]
MSPFPLLLGDKLPKYTYTPIPAGARTFRLAKLLPPEPSWIPGVEPTIRISIQTCEAGSDQGAAASVEYDALSYAWDVPPSVKGPNRRIIVDSGGGGEHASTLLIYRPLELALLRFSAANARDKGSKHELPIFIDQICINQDDNDEKAQQVRLMQAIYSHSRRAIVWLGPGTAASDTWYTYVRAICAEGVLTELMGPRVATIMRIFDALTDATIVLTDPVEMQDHKDLLALTKHFADKYPIAAYLDVLRRSYFSRLWTIQEACLAPKIVVVCGDELLCFDCFRAGMFFYNVQNSWWLFHLTGSVSRKELYMRDAVFDATETFRRIYSERKAIHERGNRAPLHKILINYSLSNSSRWKVSVSLAQDRVYGLLGLTAPDDPVKMQLGIYYNIENQLAAQVRAYTETAGLILEQGHLDMLLFNQMPKITEGLPSWVPDWAMDLALPVAWAALHEPAFTAGGLQDAAEVHADASTGRLLLKGGHIGRVTAVGQMTYTTESISDLSQVKYTDAKLVFDEVDQFVHAALASRATEPPSSETLTNTCLRVYDSGLSFRHFQSKLASPEAGAARLLALQSSIADLGARLLRAATTARSYSIFNIYATIGITPWYLDYYRATTVLHRLARGPTPLAGIFILALADLVEDVIGLCVASARVQYASLCIALRQRFGRRMLKVTNEQMRSVGLDPDVAKGEDMTAFLANLQRNVGRRVLRTAEGHVGMGPREMEPGDEIVVLYGLTTPLVVRPVEGVQQEWTVVGEAYCDGVMNGEALGVNDRELVLV